MMLKTFDYKTLNNLEITPEMTKKLMEISLMMGKQSTKNLKTDSTLKRLIEVAKIQSTDASNRIEGIFTSDTRLRKIVAEKTMPHNRSEEEISGYRDVLNLIHQQNQYIPITSNTILTLHKHLFGFTASTWGGHYKDIDNEIIARYEDGRSEIRFTPPKAFITPELIENLCTAYNDAINEDAIPSLLLIGAFVFDFVSIHPFRNGNGRMSRLLMLLTMYKSGFEVGKFISIESLIEKTKPAYYVSLQNSSRNWATNKNSYQPFLDYFLSIVLQAYRDLQDRLQPSEKKISVTNSIINNLQDKLYPLSKRELSSLIPEYSLITIERALKELLDSKRIKKVGAGRSTKYILIFSK
ncbi:Fic family protein [Companilactobacillus futsaii]|uniref:Fic family protein n=3 Tax=Companilactobacillus futsaii TaxID=938155 RepID=A0A5B7T0I7_9LACO|nr:Fic family protein [Companilactobacillus futsaii]KRK93658.1 filamentation induced by cAMP protein Fic [Companilactobacillus futsaii JCM 17355]QCX23745.1 Fic family protein [Companilactobacillus futsaii]